MFNGIRKFLGLKPVYTLNIVPKDDYTPNSNSWEDDEDFFDEEFERERQEYYDEWYDDIMAVQELSARNKIGEKLLVECDDSSREYASLASERLGFLHKNFSYPGNEDSDEDYEDEDDYEDEQIWGHNEHTGWMPRSDYYDSGSPYYGLDFVED